jgi:hypothetical protein
MLHSPASFTDVAGFIAEELGIQMLVDSVRHYITKLPRFRAVKGIPINAHRFGCDPFEINHDYDTPEAVLQDIPAALVINLETGYDEWLDGHAEEVVAPNLSEEPRIRIPAERSVACDTVHNDDSGWNASEGVYYYQSGNLRSRIIPRGRYI